MLFQNFIDSVVQRTQLVVRWLAVPSGRPEFDYRLGTPGVLPTEPNAVSVKKEMGLSECL
jgi:hypothetical protein